MAKVLGLHVLALKPEVNEQEFESFVLEQIAPLYRRIPGQTAYLLKGDRGERKGKYLFVIELEGQEVRDRTYPPAGDAWGLSEAFDRALKGTEPVWNELATFVAQFPDPHFTDYVLVSG